MAQPVIVLTVLLDGPLDTFWQRNLEVMLDDIRRPLNHPGEDRAASIPEKVIAVVFDVALAFDLRIKGNHDQPSPDSGVLGTHLGKVIGIEHDGMAGRIGKGIFVLFLRRHIVRGAQLLYDGGVQAGTFLKLGGDQHAFALGLRQLRAHIALAAHGQCICGDIAAIGAEHMSQGIPEGGFAVAAIAIGNDERFHEHFSHGDHSGDLLHIANQLLVAAEEQVQGILPQRFPVFARLHGGHLRNKVIRAVWHRACQTESQVIGALWCVQQEGISVQILGPDQYHGLHLRQNSLDVFGLAVIHGRGLVPDGPHIGQVRLQLIVVHVALGLLLAFPVHQVSSAVLLQNLIGLRCGSGCFLQLHVGQVVHDGMGAGLGFLPDIAVVHDEICRR